MADTRSPRSLTRARRFTRAARLESLETRALLSAVAYSSVSDHFGFSGQAQGAAIDGSGNLWIGNFVGAIDKITKAADGSLSSTEYAIPDGENVFSITYDAVTNSIYTSNGGPNIFQFNISAGAFTSAPTTIPLSDGVLQMTATPDGAVWFVTAANNIGRLDPSGSVVTAPIPSNGNALGIGASSSNSLWVGTAQNNTSATLTSSVNHVSWDGATITVQNYAIGNTGGILSGATADADGSAWWAIGNDTTSPSSVPTTTPQIDHGVIVNGQLSVTQYNLPLSGASAAPIDLQFDANGTLWFAEATVGSDTAALSSLDPASGDFNRTLLDPGLQPVNLAVSATDVWATITNDPNGAIVVADASTTPPILASDPGINATVNTAFSGSIATFASTEAGNFAYTIDYGNGQTSTGTLANSSNGLYIIPGNATYTAAGTYNLSVTITSAAGNVALVNGAAVVTSFVPILAQGIGIAGQKDIALAPNVSGQATLVVAQFSGAPASYSASINWGDNTSSTGSIVSLGNNQYAVKLPAGATKTYAAIGNFNITVTITDGTQVATATSIASIGAVPVVASQSLVLEPLHGPNFSGTVGTFTADPLATANWFKATISWGDGSTSVGLILKVGTGQFSIIGLHHYKKGAYAIKTTIVDSVDAETALATASIDILK